MRRCATWDLAQTKKKSFLVLLPQWITSVAAKAIVEQTAGTRDASVTIGRKSLVSKIDMSDSCNFMYFSMFSKMTSGNISLEEWERWYEDHCGKCEFMNEICMYEERMNAVIATLNAIGCTSFRLTAEEINWLISDGNTKEVENCE